MPTIPRDNVDVNGFLKRFSRFGEQPSVEGYVDLFEPAGTVQHPGMPRPLSGEEIRKFISTVLASMPDFRLQPVAWCSHSDVVFVEAMTTGSAQGAHAAWSAIYCVKLNGDRVVTGRSYYDRAEIFSQLQGGRTRQFEERISRAGAGAPRPADPLRMTRIEDEFIRPYVEAWQAPEAKRISNFYIPTGSAFIPGYERVRRD
jgi:limonene-1,2-epoxide hydrolase